MHDAQETHAERDAKPDMTPEFERVEETENPEADETAVEPDSSREDSSDATTQEDHTSDEAAAEVADATDVSPEQNGASVDAAADNHAADNHAADNHAADNQWNVELEQASQPFVGRWSQLVSNTNWEKGRIIAQWREALVDAGAPATEYSDEAWSRRVGGVTGQHVGRLRRVYQRFGQTYEQFSGLFWSHFQAAVDWDDAEMWLEGAVQSRWSVSQMRNQRWETLGGDQQLAPRDEDVVSGELDEDFEPSLKESPSQEDPQAAKDYGDYAENPGPRPEGPDFGDESEGGNAAASGVAEDTEANLGSQNSEPAAVELVRPFERLGELPDDIGSAMEDFKLAIIHHRSNGWEEISCDDVLAALDALKALAVAPAAE